MSYENTGFKYASNITKKHTDEDYNLDVHNVKCVCYVIMLYLIVFVSHYKREA